MQASPTLGIKLQQKELSLLIENLLEQEEIYWAQRGKVSWLCRGDRNTTYFYHSASARRRRKLIKKFKNSDDIWVEGNDNLKPLIRDYFHGLFTSDMGVVD